MPETYREYVERIVDAFPPLTDEQRDRLAALLTPAPDRPAGPHADSERSRNGVPPGRDVA